jgi:tyrosyl-tRNA synthetase
MKTKEQIVEEILTRGVSEVIDCENLKKRLLSEEKLRIKFGTDPTSPSIHLGRAVGLLKLRDLQQLGHQIVFIIGDFTGVIGDTSDKESERPMLEQAVIEKNLETYFEQAGKILDMSKVEKHRNSDWLGKLTYVEIADQANAFSLAEFIARENIKKRLDKGTRISLRELLYPLMQGYDSVMVNADVEIGGTDQRFNLLAGRELQRQDGQQAQDILMVNLIEGLDGRKMSSSWGNVIKLLDEPNEMLGKIMSMGDELILKYYIHCTRVPMEEIKKIEIAMAEGTLNPRDAKLQLASEIVKIYHSEEDAEKAKQYFIKTISNKEIPTEVAEFKVETKEIKLSEFLLASGNASSLGDAKRKIEQGGVSVDGEKILEPNLLLDNSFDDKVFKIGKLGFIKIKF